MTAKQKAARARFKAVVAEAKKLRKKNPKLTQAQAVKQAWAISYTKQRSGKKLGAVKKKSATKIKAKKSKRTSEMHTDTKSHNVNIRVMSGIDKTNIHHVLQLKHLTNNLTVAQYHLKKAIESKKLAKDTQGKIYFARMADRLRDEIKATKKQITIQKRLIK